jgi:hypothetical protein
MWIARGEAGVSIGAARVNAADSPGIFTGTRAMAA